jgi:metal-dependent amidase/aminoacylase/carboxypeptidase family protein
MTTRDQMNANVMDAEVTGEMRASRRTLHAHPETAFEEVSTAALVASVLRDCRWDRSRSTTPR